MYGGVPPLTVTASVAVWPKPAGAVAATAASTMGFVAVSSLLTVVVWVATTETPVAWAFAKPDAENVTA